MVHLSAVDRRSYFDGLSPGANVEHQATDFSPQLLNELREAVTDSRTGRARFAHADFTLAAFTEDAAFADTDFDVTATFSKIRCRRAVFRGARFNGHTVFVHAQIREEALFDGAVFGRYALFGHLASRSADFTSTVLQGRADFSHATITGDLGMEHSTFHSALVLEHACVGGTLGLADTDVRGDLKLSNIQVGVDLLLDEASLAGDLALDGTRVAGNIALRQLTLPRVSRLGPLMTNSTLDLSGTTFAEAVTIEAAARRVSCRRTRFASTAALRLRYAAVDLTDAVLEFPVSVSGQWHRPFDVAPDGELALDPLADRWVHILSLQGVDAAHLQLSYIDLRFCRFAGTVHLDQLSIDGHFSLAEAPYGVHWRGLIPVRYTRRRTLIEEHHWRAQYYGGGWIEASDDVDAHFPTSIAPIYRQLRKALEDGKHEPGAADFYYGEMEMRRQAVDIPLGESVLLTAYWAVSGYGMRAARAFAWLLAAMVVTVLVMMAWGLPRHDVDPVSRGVVHGRHVTLTQTAPDPVNPSGPLRKRLTGDRFDKSLRVVINSVVFRSSGQSLTTAGTYTEMTSRIVEPVFLGLGLLAIRSRVKR
ncbi:pentapeptide repeat-containing protein [Streptomyces sp. SID8367]|nr:pentapeptide repeat-containing protein [Streptomyces sp. SID8367]MYT68351.1 pentapeptide repeat-containing protein [Streptomyces sp. SID8367]